MISVILLSIGDRFPYFCNGLHGDFRQYDLTDPKTPDLTGQVWIAGLPVRVPDLNGVKVGGTQMIRLGLDGKRHCVTASLFSIRENPFDPEVRTNSGCTLMVYCDTENCGMAIDPDFIVDFGQEPYGPGRTRPGSAIVRCT